MAGAIKPIVKVPSRFGAIAGILGAIALIVLYYFGRHPLLVFIFFDFRILLFGIFIFFTLKELRDFHYEGLLSFGEGLLSSFIFISVFGVIASGGLWLFATVEPEFIASFIEEFKNQVRTFSEEDIQAIGKENLDRNLKALSSTNGFQMAWSYFKQCYWIGLFVSIILSVILRRQPKT